MRGGMAIMVLVVGHRGPQQLLFCNRAQAAEVGADSRSHEISTAKVGDEYEATANRGTFRRSSRISVESY